MQRVDHRLRREPNPVRIPMFRACNRESPSVFEAVPFSKEKEKDIMYMSDKPNSREAHPEAVGYDVRD